MFRGVSARESEVAESDEFDSVTELIRRWSSLPEDECQWFLSVNDGVLNEFLHTLDKTFVLFLQLSLSLSLSSQGFLPFVFYRIVSSSYLHRASLIVVFKQMACHLAAEASLIVVFKQMACHLATESNVEQVSSRAGQLSEVNFDSDALSDMVSNIVNKYAYKPSLHDLMDKCYEMFRGKNHTNKKDFFNSLDSPDHSDQD